MNDLSGHTIRGYVLRERIGAGAFGAVYRAYQPNLNRDIALKVIVPAVAAQPQFVEKFDAEAYIVARLEHPYIVPLFDYWRDESGAYLAMRWLRGGSLRQLLKRGPLPNEIAIRIVDQIAAALATAHRSGVVHRDLKPDNILLDDDGNAYLSDFGIAIEVGSSENADTGEMVGSAAYMSPEQISGQKVTTRSDIYSFGILLYEMLTGRHPYIQGQTFDILRCHLTQPVPNLCEIRPDLSAALNDVIQRATAKSPDARYADALSMAAAVHLYLSDDSEGSGARARLYHHANALPNRARRIIGREALLARANELLDRKERVLLHGFGGMGKTTLAAAIAEERLLLGSEKAVLWLEAGIERASMLLEAIAVALGEGQAVARKSRHDRTEIIRRLLSERQLLVVLDNVWNDQALFETLAAIPNSNPVLMTSRHAIPIDGELLDVAELNTDQALELLSYYAGKSHSDPGEALSLCRLLGYHTFALEIAGRILKVEKHLTPARLMARIGEAPHDLRVPGSFATVGRESVKDLLDASIQELSEPSRAVFTAMGSLFSPQATLELLALVLGEDVQRTEAALADLQQRGLVEVVFQSASGLDHYRLHDLTYSYARALSRAQKRDDDAPIRAARAFVDKHLEDYDLLDFEQRNILAAARAAHERGDPGSLIHIMNALNVTGSYFSARGHNARSLEILRLAIDAALKNERISTAHFLLCKLGNTYANLLGDFDRALTAYQEAEQLAVRMGDHHRQALLLSAIGTVRARQGADDAADYLRSAYELARSQQDDIALGQILEHLGYQAAIRQDYEVARQYYQESFEVAGRLNNVERLFFALSNLGAAEQALGNYPTALDLNHRALAIARANSEDLWCGYALECIGEACHCLNNRERAQRAFDEALDIFCRLGARVRAQALIRIMEAGNYIITNDCIAEGSAAHEEIT